MGFVTFATRRVVLSALLTFFSSMSSLANHSTSVGAPDTTPCHPPTPLQNLEEEASKILQRLTLHQTGEEDSKASPEHPELHRHVPHFLPIPHGDTGSSPSLSESSPSPAGLGPKKKGKRPGALVLSDAPCLTPSPNLALQPRQATPMPHLAGSYTSSTDSGSNDPSSFASSVSLSHSSSWAPDPLTPIDDEESPLPTLNFKSIQTQELEERPPTEGGGPVLLGKGTTKAVFLVQVRPKGQTDALWNPFASYNMRTDGPQDYYARSLHELQLVDKLQSSIPTIARVHATYVKDTNRFVYLEYFEDALSNYTSKLEKIFIDENGIDRDGAWGVKVHPPKKSLSPLQALSAVDQICQTIYKAHDLNIVNNDIKPDNMYLSFLVNPTLSTSRDQPDPSTLIPHVGVADWGAGYELNSSFTHSFAFKSGSTPNYTHPNATSRTSKVLYGSASHKARQALLRAQAHGSKEANDKAARDLEAAIEIDLKAGKEAFEEDKLHDHWGFGNILVELLTQKPTHWVRETYQDDTAITLQMTATDENIQKEINQTREVVQSMIHKAPGVFNNFNFKDHIEPLLQCAFNLHGKTCDFKKACIQFSEARPKIPGEIEANALLLKSR